MQQLVKQFIDRMIGRVNLRCYERLLIQDYDGIKICDVTIYHEEASSEQFRSKIIQALEKVKQHDLRRYSRIQRHLRYVVNSPCVGGGKYHHYPPSCEIDFPRFTRMQNEDWCLLELARTLVHEATHGAVRSWTIPQTIEKRLQEERLCYEEEVRFLRRVRPDWEQPAFDEQWHREVFQQGIWKYKLRYINRLLQGKEPFN